MDRNLTSLLTLSATAAISVTLAAVAPDGAYADDITADTTPFSGDKTRAEVRAALACPMFRLLQPADTLTPAASPA